jgi:hypothetical protein
MKRLVALACVAAVLAAAVLATGPAGAQGDKAPTVKEIMGKAHKGPNSVIATLGKELRADDPDWADIQKHTKELVTLGSGLAKNEPPKGEKASWQKLTQGYVTTARDLDAAAQRKDKNAATAAHKKLTGSCTGCHNAHRG